MNTNWRKELEEIGIDSKDIVALVPSNIDLDVMFYGGYGGSNGVPFVAYTDKWAVFCVVYDGAEWLEKVPRNPDPDFKPKHVGGE